jgi:ADP-heptose:LPS heptosyltransferase
LLEKWRKKVDAAAGDAAIKIGLAWAGRPTHKQDKERSVKLARFANVSKIEGVKLFSLQKGPAAAEANPAPAGMSIANLTGGLADFSDTAAFVANLDLVIAVDTAVVHLAGALGKPVWTLLAFAPDWRWLLARDDSPWYPSMRLFRQPAIGDWNAVFAQVEEELRKRVATRSHP